MTQLSEGSLPARGSNENVARMQGAQAHPQVRFPIIVHCHLRWDFVWQRPQQIFSRLARNHRVLFIEDAIPGEGEARLELSEPHPNVVRVVPRVPASVTAPDAQSALVLPLLEAALEDHPLLSGRFDDAVQWFYSPMTAPTFLGKFGTRGLVYDCMDELANFRFAPPELREREQDLLMQADVVFTGGYQLYESKSRHHPNVHFYGCGVDVEHFGKARKAETKVPEKLAALSQPVFGYFGVIDERIDYELIDALAGRFPDASIAMVGPFAKIDPDHLPRRDNIHWLGQADYEDLPALVKGFDVCLMPFALNDATRYINPTKTLEYMAAGKPIVSTAIADVVRNFTPIAEVADSHAEFLDAVGRAWDAPNTRLIEKGIERANNSTWDATVRAMEGHIRDAVILPIPAQASA